MPSASFNERVSCLLLFTLSLHYLVADSCAMERWRSPSALACLWFCTFRCMAFLPSATFLFVRRSIVLPPPAGTWRHLCCGDMPWLAVYCWPRCWRRGSLCEGWRILLFSLAALPATFAGLVALFWPPTCEEYILLHVFLIFCREEGICLPGRRFWLSV